MRANIGRALRRTSPLISSTRTARHSTMRCSSPAPASRCDGQVSKADKYAALARLCPLVPKEHLKAPIPDDCHVLKLSDGRLMSYAEYGSKSPDAHPFIFCHGIPDCRLDACLLPSDQQLAEKLNIRWIGVDRPGMGFSSMHEGRTVIDWVSDIRQLIDYLKLPAYYILSVSGGTAYALASAMLLPRDQVKGVGIMIGVAPWEAGMSGMSLPNRLGFLVYKHYPGIFEWVHKTYMVPPMQLEDPGEAEKIVRKTVKYMSKEDKKNMEHPGMIEAVTRLDREVYRQGARGLIEDSKTHTKHWGFEVADVAYPGIRLWYGKDDVNTPPAMGQYLAARLPGSVYKEFEGKTHFTMWHHMEEILTDMLKKEDKA